MSLVFDNIRCFDDFGDPVCFVCRTGRWSFILQGDNCVVFRVPKSCDFDSIYFVKNINDLFYFPVLSRSVERRSCYIVVDTSIKYDFFDGKFVRLL